MKEKLKQLQALFQSLQDDLTDFCLEEESNYKDKKVKIILGDKKGFAKGYVTRVKFSIVSNSIVYLTYYVSPTKIATKNQRTINIKLGEDIKKNIIFDI